MTHFLVTDCEEVFSFEEYLAANDDTRWVGNQAQKRKSTYALSTGAFAYQTYRLSFVYIIGNTVNCPDLSLLGVEVCLEVFNFENFLCDVSSPRFYYFSDLNHAQDYKL